MGMKYENLSSLCAVCVKLDNVSTLPHQAAKLLTISFRGFRELGMVWSPLPRDQQDVVTRVLIRVLPVIEPLHLQELLYSISGIGLRWSNVSTLLRSHIQESVNKNLPFMPFEVCVLVYIPV